MHSVIVIPNDEWVGYLSGKAFEKSEDFSNYLELDNPYQVKGTNNCRGGYLEIPTYTQKYIVVSYTDGDCDVQVSFSDKDMAIDYVNDLDIWEGTDYWIYDVTLVNGYNTPKLIHPLN